MTDFSFAEMQEMQKNLQEKYKDKWEPLSYDKGRHQLLWLIGEIGEVIDVIKKNGGKQIVENDEVRRHFIEEMADVLMHYNDVMLCYRIGIDELKQVYSEKFEKNMNRW